MGKGCNSENHGYFVKIGKKMMKIQRNPFFVYYYLDNHQSNDDYHFPQFLMYDST